MANPPGFLAEYLNSLTGAELAEVRTAVGVKAAQPPRIVGTNGRGNGQLLATSATHTTFEMRLPFYIGNGSPYIQIPFDNWGIGPTGGDAVPPTAITITEAAVEKLLTTTPIYFDGGSRSTSITAGTTKFSRPVYATDFGQPNFRRGETYWIRLRGTVPTLTGQMFSNAEVGAVQFTGSYGTRFDPTVGTNSISQVDAVGAMTAKTGQTDFGAGLNFGAIIGLPLDPRIPSVYGQGTSIDNISNDGDSASLRGGAAWIMRAMFGAANVNPIPVLNHARGSSSLIGGFTGSGGITRRSIYYQFATVAVDGHGTGDIAPDGSGVLADLQSYELTQWAAFRSAGVEKIIKPKVIPRNGSSDSWATLANQTQVSAFDTKAQAFNDWIDTQLSGGLIDSVLSQSPARSDLTTNRWKWPVTGAANYATTDGTHPNAVIHALMAADLRTVIGQFYPYAV